MEGMENLERKIRDFDNKSSNPKALQSSYPMPIGKFLSNGIDIFANVAIGLSVGLALDKYFSVKPFFLLLCLIISIISAFRMILNNR